MLDGPLTGQTGSLVAGRYRLGALIGRGATASVYKARDERLGRDVALKLFAPPFGGPDETARHETEMRLLATFNHPSLVTLFDAGTDHRDAEQPRAFLTMELVHGPDLHARLRGQPLTTAEVALVGAGLASALEYVHGRGIIHRDIKPANVLLAPAPTGPLLRPKLTDFGIARIIEGTRLTATGTTVGTAAYLSPEQATGSTLGPASDIYSLGLLLLECLTGTLEYPGTSVESAVARLHRAPRVPTALGAPWVDLLTAMTSAEPSSRPAAREVESALLAAIDSSTPATATGRTNGVTQALPRMPERPPRTPKPTVPTRIHLAALDSAGNSAVVVPAARNRWHWSGKSPGRLRRTVATVGAGFLATALLFIAVGALQQPAPASPLPSPSVRVSTTPTTTPDAPAPTPSVEPPTPAAPPPVAPGPANHKGKGKGNN